MPAPHVKSCGGPHQKSGGEAGRLNRALHESEENFRAFFEVLDDMIFVGSPDGRIIFSNRAASQKLGHTPEELRTMHLLDLHPAELRANAEEILGAMFRKERESCPLPLQKISGEFLHVETRVWPGQWDGKDCLFGLCKDITEEQEARARFELLFRNNPALMALSTLPERKFVDANVAFLSTLHLSKDEVVGKTALELGLFPDADAMRRTSEKLEAEGRLHNQELQVRRGDGTLMEGLFSAEVIVMRGRRHLLSVMIDVTALNRTTRLLEESERRLSLATKAGGVGIWDWDVVNNRLVWDDQMYRQYGITRDLFSGAYEAWTAGLHPDDRQRGDEEIQMALRGEKDFDTEFRVLWPDGSIHHIRAMALVQRNAGGEPLHMIGTNWDITKLKRAESTLLQNIARTEELARLKSRFVSMASHELRTPLANITLACELLKNFGKDMAADRSRAVFANLLNSVTFMTQTLDDLLLAGKLEEGKLSFNPGRLDLLLFLKRCCMEAQPSGEDPSRIEVAFRDAGMQVVADEQLLHHILKNLLENALKYSPPDSKVEVGAEVRRGVLTLSVSDRGIGVPEAERTFLFDAFSRASNVGDKPGSGLGLFIAQKCAQAHGGHMSYAPQPGGSVFSVTIPLPADPGSHQKT